MLEFCWTDQQGNISPNFCRCFSDVILWVWFKCWPLIWFLTFGWLFGPFLLLPIQTSWYPTWDPKVFCLRYLFFGHILAHLTFTCDLGLRPCYPQLPVSRHVFHKFKDLILSFAVQVANMIRFLVDSYNKPVPAILEIPSKDHPYDPAHDSVLSRVKYLFNTESVASGRRWIHLLQLQLFGGVCCFSLYNMDNNLFLKFRVLCSCSLNNLCCLGII